MIERQHGQMCLMCDGCDTDLEFFDQGSGFNAMIDDAKSKGWKIVNGDQGAWTHLCADCKPNPVSEARRKFGL